MNLITSTYLTTRSHLNRTIFPKKVKSQQALLTDTFFEEWKSGIHVDADKLLAEILSFTANNVHYYRKYFSQNPHRDPEKLTDWPILTRDDVWNESASLQAMQSNRWKRWTHASGGSSGKPVIVVHDEYFAAKAQALRKLCGELFFQGPHYNKLILWGMSAEVERKLPQGRMVRLKDEIRALLGIKTTHVNTFEFSQQKFDECVTALRRQKPGFIFGYAGSVYELAKYLDENAIRVPRPPEMIGTTAQMLHPFMRKRIEKVFRCRVCDHYGSREVGPVAWQHKDGVMCFPKFFSKVEVVDEAGNSVACGEPGRILVTTLHNYTMPLIRYDIGDIGVPGEDKSLRNYPFATLDEINGRSSEEFTNINGSRVCGPFFINLFYYRPWLDQFYIIQRDYDLVEIMYVLKPPAAKVPDIDLEEINQRIKNVMTDQCRIVWTQVAEMPTTRAGKRLFIRSEVSSQRFLNTSVI